jgi:ABC-type polysaccharide/polyol phosphate export permease
MIPPALRDLFRYRDLLRELVVRALKVRYRRSTIGFLWTMLHPLIMMVVWTVLFSQVFRVQVENYLVYALSGITFWQFFTQTVTSNLYSLRGNSRLLTKLPVPKALFPVATVLSGLVNFSFALVPLLGIALATGSHFTFALAFLPIGMVIATVFTLGAGLLLAPLAVIFSDTVEVVGILLSLVLYLTPVFYPPSIIPARLQPLFRLNPLAAILEVFRAPLVTGSLPAGVDVMIAMASALLVFGLGAWVFTVTSRRIPLYL